jgi:hypothetical protein
MTADTTQPVTCCGGHDGLSAWNNQPRWPTCQPVATASSRLGVELSIGINGIGLVRLHRKPSCAPRRQQDRKQLTGGSRTRQQQPHQEAASQVDHRRGKAFPVGTRHWSRCSARHSGLGTSCPLTQPRATTYQNGMTKPSTPQRFNKSGPRSQCQALPDRHGPQARQHQSSQQSRICLSESQVRERRHLQQHISHQDRCG